MVGTSSGKYFKGSFTRCLFSDVSLHELGNKVFSPVINQCVVFGDVG